MTTHYLHLTPDGRVEIEKRLDRHESLRTIAAALGRAASTIAREVRRGRWRASNENAAYAPYRDVALHASELTAAQYRAGRAQNTADTRAARSHQPTRLVTDQAITHLVSKLRDGWTPEMIAGRAHIDSPDNPRKSMSHETIYRFIYSKDNWHRRLHEYLPRGRKKRRTHHGRRVHSSTIPNRVSIGQRPTEVNARTVFGHWEGDSVLGMKSVGGSVHTEVERHSRMMRATKVHTLSSREEANAQKRIFGALAAPARRSTTIDNGTEMLLHTELITECQMDTYFADPYSSWQRGTNEHHNGRLRLYYPKGTDFSQISETELHDAIRDINNQPRKSLG